MTNSELYVIQHECQWMLQGRPAVIGRPVNESCSHMRRRCMQHVMEASF